MTTQGIDQETAQALEVARALAAAGIPIFVAPPKADPKMPFQLPSGRYEEQDGRKIKVSPGWEDTTPDPAVVDTWRPGMALCAVMGCGLDLLDVDPRNGGDPSVLDGATPASYAVAATPSGGMHSFIASLGVSSCNGAYPGVDIKAGAPDGSGRGFAFLPPTVKPSKVTGELAAYRWVSPPDLERLRRAWAEGDRSGAALAAHIRDIRSRHGVVKPRVGDGCGWWAQFLASSEPQSASAATRAINDKLAEVASWTPEAPGEFRDVLQAAGMTLGGYVGGGWLDEGDAWARLEVAVSAVWGAPDEDDRRWIRDSLTDGATAPFRVLTPEDERTALAAAIPGATPSTPPGPVVDPVAASWSPQRALGVENFDPAFAVHDQEHAEAVLARNAAVRRYAVDAGTWLRRRRFEVWSELPDQTGAAIADVARLMPLGATPLPEKKADYTDEHWQAVRRATYLSSAGAGKIGRKIMDLVTGGDHPCCVDSAELDTDREVLWAGGYPFDLRASRERPTLAAIHPDTPHLHTAAVAPSPQPVATPVFDAFLAAVFPDPALRSWAVRVLSIALTGYPDAAVPVLYGSERVGKTSFIELLVRVLGTYGHAADPRLLAGTDHVHASVVYALKGRRLSFIDEGPRRGHLAAERIKQLTGGGQLTGNAMRANPVTFRPTHTLVMTTNDEPPITDPALRARMRLIPCDGDRHAVRAARQALTEEVWAAEAPGVLAMLMREAAAWLDEPDTAGIAAAPDSVRGLLSDMASTQDPVREWVEMCTVPADPGTPGRELYRAFVAWHETQPLYRRQSPPSETAFGRSLSEQGFPSGKHDGRWYRPLSVLNGGPAGPMPTPSAAAFLGGPVAGSGGLVAGSTAQPAGAEKPSSDPVSSTVYGGLAGIDRSTTKKNAPLLHTEQYPPKNTGNTGKGANPPAPPTQQDGSPAKTGLGGSVAGTRQGDLARPEPVDNSCGQLQPTQHQDPSPTVAVEGVSVGVLEAAARLEARAPRPDLEPEVARKAEANAVNAELARLAETTGRPKTELRTELKAARKALVRQAAVEAAGGEVHALPAVVDRAGHVLPVTLEQAGAVVAAALGRTEGALTVDVETTGYPVGHQLYALRSVQLGDEVAAVVLDPVAHADAIRTSLAAATTLHAHSATADLVPLSHAGLIDPETGWARMHDTVIPAKLADPASTGSDPGLKQLATTVLGVHATAPAADEARDALFKAGGWSTSKGEKFHTQLTKPLERNGWANVATGCETMLRYAASDVLDTAALARRLPTIPEPIHRRERHAAAMTARVTDRGLQIDAERVAELTLDHQTRQATHAATVRSYGVENPGSGPQLAEAFARLGARLPVSDKGNPSVAEHVLSVMVRTAGETDTGRLAQAVLDYRHSSTALNLFLAPYAALCEHGDGRMRPTIYTLGTDTGRNSSVRPNIQQLPREGGIRSVVTADPGHVLISADFAGVELRGAAALSGDPTMQRMITEEDAGRFDGFHWAVARQAFGPQATKADRYHAKRGVFGHFYGGGIPTLAKQLGITEQETQRIVDSLKALAPGVAGWSDSIQRAVRQGHTQFPAYSGRIIHFPRDTPHKAPNYAIQGTCRELLVDALMRWSDTRWGNATLFPVHDELVIQVPAEDGETATAALLEAMTSEIYGVPIVAEADQPSAYWRDST